MQQAPETPVNITCPSCGSQRHFPEAIYCCWCATFLNNPNNQPKTPPQNPQSAKTQPTNENNVPLKDKLNMAFSIDKLKVDNIKKNMATVGTAVEKGFIKFGETAEDLGKASYTHVVGRVAPSTIKREGYLMIMKGSLKNTTDPNDWRSVFIVLKDGVMYFCTDEKTIKADLSFPLEHVKDVIPLDSLATGFPYSFKVTAVITKELSISSNPLFGTWTTSEQQELEFILRAQSKDEEIEWTRDLSAVASGLSIKNKMKEAANTTASLAGRVGVTSFTATAASISASQMMARFTKPSQ